MFKSSRILGSRSSCWTYRERDWRYHLPCRCRWCRLRVCPSITQNRLQAERATLRETSPLCCALVVAVLHLSRLHYRLSPPFAGLFALFVYSDVRAASTIRLHTIRAPLDCIMSSTCAGTVELVAMFARCLLAILRRSRGNSLRANLRVLRNRLTWSCQDRLLGNVLRASRSTRLWDQ